MFNFNKKKDLQKLKEFYRSIQISEDQFYLFNVNKNHVASFILTRELNIQNGSSISGLRVGLQGIKIYQEAFSHSSIIYQNEIVMAPEVQLNFNQLIDEIVSSQIKFFTQKLNRPTEVQSLNATSEEKALEWLRVSLKVLTESHRDLLSKNELAPSYSIYLGKNPKNSLQELRITIFNLDIIYQLLHDNNLRVLVYNNQGNLVSKNIAPSLKGDFSIRKREMFNLVIELLNELKKSYHI